MDGKTALVVIDVQRAMFEEEEAPYRSDEMLATISSLLERARAHNAPVIFIRHEEDGYAAMQPGHPSFEIHDAVAPLPDEVIFDKKSCDAFCETALGPLLEHLDVSRIVVAGMQTDLCIDSTCRSAVHRGYDVILAKDGHSTVGNGVISAEQIVAHHNRTLAGLPRPGFSIVVTPGADIEFPKISAEAALAV